MADILNLRFIRHLRADPSAHVLLFRNAKLIRSGRGLSFWFRPLSAGVAEVPVDDRELNVLFHARSADYQDVQVQGVVTYRVTDAVRLAERVDFTLDPETGKHLREPLEKLCLRVSQLAQQFAHAFVSVRPVREILAEGQPKLRDQIQEGLARDPAIVEMGLSIVSVRIAAVKPTPDLEKALAAPVREQIQQAADEAVFQRRALAVEKERAIKENELKNQIELARREEELIAQQGQNEQRQATDQAEAARIVSEGSGQRVRIEATAAAEKTRLEGEAMAGSVRQVEGAKADIERARMDVMRSLPPTVIFGLAARELAGKLERIDHLNLSPETFGPMIRDLMEAGTRRLEAAPETP